MELFTLLVYIILIHFICNKEDIVSIAYVNNLLDILLGKHLACRISRIYNDDALEVEVLRLGMLDLLFDIVDIQSPILFLI